MTKVASTMLVLILLSCLSAAVSGNVVINEIMINPVTSSGQWIELHNTAETPVSMEGWHLHADIRATDYVDYEKNVSLTYYFPSNVTIGGNGYLVIGNNGTFQRDGGFSVEVGVLLWTTFPMYPKNGTTIGQGNNYIYVHGMEKGQASDFVEWNTDAAADPQYRLPFVPGASLSRNLPLETSQDPSNWKASTRLLNCTTGTPGGDRATPGQNNTVTCPIHSPTSKAPTKKPTKAPTNAPTKAFTKKPTKAPAKEPTKSPTKAPTKLPTRRPSKSPTKAPAKEPTKAPMKSPTKSPSVDTTKAPTKFPTKAPSKFSTKEPTRRTTMAPTIAPVSSSQCKVQCTFARIFRGVKYHRTTSTLGDERCMERCKIFFPDFFLRRDWKCGRCP